MLDTFIKKYKEDRDSTIIVTTTKAKTDKVNFDIQMMLLKEGLIDESSSYITKPSNTAGKFYKMYIGDNVMILTNNYNAKNFTDKTYEDLEDFIFEEDKRKSKLENSPIFNGEIYTIKDIVGDYVILSNKDGDVLIDDLSLECSLAYCSNCHKLQGSTMANALIYHTSDYTDRHIMCSSQWLYTGYTRAKKYLGIFTDEYKNLSIGARTNAIDEKVTILELIMK
jgi:ATP-dependent exoDNAse (exonuclease V) alpha subunit